MHGRVPVVLVVFLALPTSALSGFAQEYRGSITGRVMDPSGAVIPGIQVVAKNSETGVAAAVVTDEAGRYFLLYVLPGSYTVSVEVQGFKKFSRPNIDVHVGDQLTIDIGLEAGGVEDTVEVRAGTPLLERESASLGDVVDGMRLTDLPMADHNPLNLARLAPGVTYSGGLQFTRSTDNGGVSSFSANGGAGGNEFTIDGAPNNTNTAGSSNVVAYVPPADAVREFKVQTATFDAQQGHTTSAVINMALKSGTNVLHGTAQYFSRSDVFAANDFFLNRAGLGKTPLNYNLENATLGGPLRVPGLYDGHAKTFFFLVAEGMTDRFPEPKTMTVPTLAERQGNFSALLPLGFKIYDPLTAVRRADGRIERQPFANNIIPSSRISPMAKAFIHFYPLPNVTGDVDGRNNFVSGNPRTDTFTSETLRLDHQATSRQRLSLSFKYNHRHELRDSWTSELNGIIPTGNGLTRENYGGTYDHLLSLTGSTVLDVRAVVSGFAELNERPSNGKLNIASLGFSPQTLTYFGNAAYLPQLDITSFAKIGDTRGETLDYTTYSFQPTLTTVRRGHQVRAGYDLRVYRENFTPQAYQAGLYEFHSDYTRQTDTSPDQLGQALAAFMLGQPTGGRIERIDTRANQVVYHGFFVQDDWKFSTRLTLNLGLRYDYEGAPTERFNRNLRGLDLVSPSPIEAAARAQYALSPIPEVSPENFRVRGGPLFADAQHRSFWSAAKDNFQPRLGFAFALNDRTVLRGGWAIFTGPIGIGGIFQTGYKQATNIIASRDTGRTFHADFANPFPDGVADPLGPSLGLLTNMGQDIEAIPGNPSNSQVQRWQLSVQRELPGKVVAEAAYVGSHGYDLSRTVNLNAIPRQYLSTSGVRDDAVINFLNARFPNPFQGLGPSGNGRTDNRDIARRDLLRAYPQFNNVKTRSYDGTNDYRAAQLRLSKRFNRGYTVGVAYTYSNFMEQVSTRNDTDVQLERRLSRNDTPHRLAANGILELPFGHGRRWGASWPSPVDVIAGAWQLGFVYEYQSGRPLDLGGSNLAYSGDPTKLTTVINSGTVDAAFNTSGFYFHDATVQMNGVDNPVKQRADRRISLADNIRTFPTRIDGFREQNTNNWNVSVLKSVKVNRVTLQLRAEVLNALNRPQFGDPVLNPTNADFGKILSQSRNFPRQVQVGAKISF